MSTTPASRYIVMEASAKVGGNARKYGRYIHVAVVEVEVGAEPKMISTRAKGVRRIVWDSGAVSVGKTDRCAAAVARAEARARAEALNAGR